MPFNYNLKYDKQDHQQRWRSMKATPTRPSKRTSGQEPRRITNKNRTGNKAEHGQDKHFNNTYKEMIVTDKEIKYNLLINRPTK
jgi:hypothetical protein